jgi:cystathionine beta-lyase family protein involved in aluminum resistance
VNPSLTRTDYTTKLILQQVITLLLKIHTIILVCLVHPQLVGKHQNFQMKIGTVTAAVTAKGKQKYNKVYSKRSKNWRIVTVKESKTYDFWPMLAARIMQKIIDDEESIKRKVVIPKEHPKNY